MTPPDARTLEHWRNLVGIAKQRQQAGLAALKAGRLGMAERYLEDVNGALRTIHDALTPRDERRR